MPAISRLIPAPPRRTRRTSGAPTGYAVPTPEVSAGSISIRPFIRRWITAAMLLVAATIAVVYVSNAIAVNDLLSNITSLERERDVVRGENERLRAELLRLMSVERVTSIATVRLGMTQPVRPPISLPLQIVSGATPKHEANTPIENE